MMNPRSAPVASMAESITSASTSSSTRADPRPRKPIEQRRDRPEIDDARHMTRSRIGRVVGEEDQLGAAAPAQPDLVAVPQRPLGHLLVVDERAAARPSILQDEAAIVLPDDLGVLARNVDADRAQIALAPAADAEDRLVDDDDPRTERVVDLQARRFDVVCFGHGHAGFAFSTPISMRNPVKS